MLKTDVIQKAVIIDSEGKMLAIRRSDTDTRRPLQWDLPGGHLDEGESLVEGIKREIMEETGLRVSDVKLVFTKTEVRSWSAGKANVIFLIYAAKADSAVIKLSYEHDRYQWIEFSQIDEYYEYVTQNAILHYIADNELEL